MFHVKDIILYTVFLLTIAMAVNHYGELNIGFLNEIQATIFPGLDEEEDEFSYYTPYGCSDPSKVSGDSKIILRDRITKAKLDRDFDKVEQLQEQLNQIIQRELASCE